MKKRGHTHRLDMEDRMVIQACIAKGDGLGQIAARLKANKSTVPGEIARGSTVVPGLSDIRVLVGRTYSDFLEKGGEAGRVPGPAGLRDREGLRQEGHPANHPPEVRLPIRQDRRERAARFPLARIIPLGRSRGQAWTLPTQREDADRLRKVLVSASALGSRRHLAKERAGLS